MVARQTWIGAAGGDFGNLVSAACRFYVTVNSVTTCLSGAGCLSESGFDRDDKKVAAAIMRPR